MEINKPENGAPEKTDNTPAIENKNEKLSDVAAEQVTWPEKPKSRFAKTVTFSPDEFTDLESIYKAREESGISADWNHFIRQMIDYTITQRWKERSFAVPKGATVKLKNTFKPLD